MERAKGWKYFCSVCYSCVGGWASFSSWHLLSPGWGNIQESSFSLTVILPSPNETRAVFWERGSKKSEGLKEEQDNSLFSFLPWITSLLLCRAKTRERGKGSSLMPSDHLTSKNAKETRKVKHHPQRCRAAHAVLAEPFQSMQVFFRTICTGKCCQVFSPPTPLFEHVRPVQLFAVWHPRLSGGFPLPLSNMELVFAVHSVCQESWQE